MSSDNAKRMYSNDDDKPWANPHYELPDHVVRVESLKREINQYEHVVDVLEKDVAKLEEENVALRTRLAAAEARVNRLLAGLDDVAWGVFDDKEGWTPGAIMCARKLLALEDWRTK